MLVRVTAVPIADTVTVPETGDFRAIVDDGSGPVSIIMHRNIFFDLAPFAPDTVITAIGLLVPTDTGSWVVWPRSVDDVLRR